MPKGQRSPAIERLDNVLNVTTLVSNITASQSDLKTADDTFRQVIALTGDKMTDELREKLEKQLGTGAAFVSLRDNVMKLCQAMRVATRVIEEGANSEQAKKLASFMLENGYFAPTPVQESKKEGK